MSSTQKLLSAIVGLGLIGVYSWIMTAGGGNSSWAWLILLAGIGMLVSTARPVAARKADQSGAE